MARRSLGVCRQTSRAGTTLYTRRAGILGSADTFGYSFFFQAEDGIRDLTVTGVQTCARPAGHAGGNHACRRAQEGRGRHRLPPERSRGGGDQADAGSAAGGAAGGWRLLAGLSRPVGSEISLARATRAAGREPGDRPPGGERGRDPRLLAADRQYRPAELRVRAALRSTP